MTHYDKIVGSIPEITKRSLKKIFKDHLSQITESKDIAIPQAGLEAISTISPMNLDLFNKCLHFVGTLISKEGMKIEPFCFSKAALNGGVDIFLKAFYGMLGLDMSDNERYFRSNLINHLACHDMAGNWVYQITSGLSGALKDTELRGLVTDDLHLPYPALYLEVPKNSGLKVWNYDSGWHDLEGMYIVEDPKYFYTVKYTDPIETLKDPTLPTCRVWRFMLVGERKGTYDINGHEVDNDALSFFRVSLLPGKTLDDAIKILEEEMKIESEADSFGEMANYWTVPFKWAMNAIMYTTNIEAGHMIVTNREVTKLQNRIAKIKGKTKKKQQLQQRLNSLDPKKRIILGEKITINRKEGEPSEKDIGFDLNVRVQVAGHWRRVPYGPRSSLRKWKWIQPYWKGPEDGVFKNKKHVLR